MMMNNKDYEIPMLDPSELTEEEINLSKRSEGIRAIIKGDTGERGLRGLRGLRT